MIQKYVAYAVTAVALAVLLSSTARISFAILSNGAQHDRVPVVVDGFDVVFDDDREQDVGVNWEGVGVTDWDDEPLLPIHRRKLAVERGESGPEGVSDVLPRLAQMTERTRRLEENMLPYDCGMILYDHHIPGEGGDELNRWIKRVVKSNHGANATFLRSEVQDSKEQFVSRVDGQIERMGMKEWMVVHSHTNGLAFATDEDVLRSWRDAMEGKGCRLVAAQVFSDPLDHFIKYTKQLFAECNCTMPEFKPKIFDWVESDQLVGQLDHFLFNSGSASSMGMKDKVKLGIRLLNDHFDVVLLDGEGDFSKELLRITGWTSHRKVKEASVSDGGLVYSKDLVSKSGKMATKNGDADFIDAVNHVYHDSLGFLMLW